MGSINCTMCQSFCKPFFTGSIKSNKVKDYIYAHLLTCTECLRYYKTMARNLGLTFRLKNEVIVFVRGLPAEIKNESKSREILREMGINCLKNPRHKRYTDAAEKMNIQVLTELKSMEDILQERYEFSIGSSEKLSKEIESVRLYAQFLATKICKTIDYLEDCYDAEFSEGL